MKQFSIPIYLIRQYCFCPRIPFFIEVVGLQPVQPLWVTQGSKYHIRQELLSKNRVLRKYNIDTAKRHYNFHMYSEYYGIYGYADLILESESEVFPIEFKTTFNPLNRGYLLQLVAYGLLSSIIFQKEFRTGFLVYGQKGRIKQIDKTDLLMEQLEKTIFQIHQVLQASVLPCSSASYLQCGQCEFLNYCNDRF
ncbi:MAG: CRISPR-associated protein Cas4 [Candidatus Auribacterota bacterium]